MTQIDVANHLQKRASIASPLRVMFKNLQCLPLALVPGIAFGGAIYGTVRIEQRPTPNVQVVVACPNFRVQPAASASAVTDTRGSYSLWVEATGRCEMRLQFENIVGTPLVIFSSTNPIKFDADVDAKLNAGP